MNLKDGFWKAALGVAGLAAVGAAVFYGLYKDFIRLTIFSQLTPEQTFAIMKLFLYLVFGALVVMVLAWLWSKKSSPPAPPPNGTTVFDPPANRSFAGVIEGLAQTGKSAVTFKGFSKAELGLPVKSVPIETSTLETALMTVGKLTTPQLTYTVEKKDGYYEITKTP